MKILVLDSGVFTGHPILQNESIDGYGLIYDENEGVCSRVPEFEDNIGHGTAVYSLIRKNCSCADIKMVKIFNRDLEISEDAFVSILTYISQHECPDILNLSLGITMCTNVNALYEICKQIQQRGTIIISAFSNDGSISYPAAFDCVYGVSGISDITQVQEVAYIQNSYVNLCAKGTVSRLAWKDPPYIFMTGNSFSCAMATAAIANAISSHKINIDEIPITVEVMKVSDRIPFEIKRAALFPFNKEMHSLVRFSHLLPFDIIDIYDHKYSGHVNANVKKLLNDETIIDKIIKDIASIDWEKIDTLIIGHVGELSRLTHDTDLLKKIILHAKQCGVNIYAFDPCEKDEGVFSIQIDKNNLPNNHFNKLFKIGKPVLGIWGTSSRQGKFTLQLILREMLQKEGYKVGQLGTEPSSLLFQMDEIFPYGYNSKITISEAEAILYINRLMNNICVSDCDLIIVGAQSAAITYDISNLDQFIPYQYAFLCSTCPDAVVLLVSPHDSIDYIQRTVEYIENVSQGTVIALCVFPKYIESSAAGFYENYKTLSCNELAQYKKHLQSTLNKKTYILGDKADMRKLTDSIIDFF